MKRILNSVLLLGALTMGFFSCSQDEDVASGSAQPIIKYTRAIESEKADSLIVGGSMGQTIAIIGQGLEDVCEVKFNDQYALLNPVYVTSEAIICTIPAVMPTVVDNLLTVYTKKGKSCTTDFAVTIPSPTVSSISCEWAPDGTSATIYGKSFYAREDGTIDVLFPGNMAAKVNSFDDYEINVTVPVGTQAGLISVENDYGKGNSQFTFRDSEGIFIYGDDAAEWNNWGLSGFSDVDPLDGAYVTLVGATGSWAWPANGIQLFYVNPTGAPLVSEGSVSDYALRFECRSYEWHDTPMLVWFDNDASHGVDTGFAQYHWRPYLTAPDNNYVTDGWVTVTMPLAEFVYSKDESETSRSISSLGEVVNLSIMFFGATDTDATSFDLNLNIDNVRLVNIK
ncbi:MAG: glycan-binding surface protein [Rikenellaceae bacterium]